MSKFSAQVEAAPLSSHCALGHHHPLADQGVEMGKAMRLPTAQSEAVAAGMEPAVFSHPEASVWMEPCGEPEILGLT